MVFPIFADQEFCAKGIKSLSQIDACPKERQVEFSDEANKSLAY